MHRPTYTLERSLYLQGFAAVVGVDEAGSGAWAGPVFAGAVLVHPSTPIPGVRDSKQLTAHARERLFEEIKKKAVRFCAAMANTEEITTFGIREAGFMAMRRALAGIPEADYVLVDGFKIRSLLLPQESVVRGDQSVRSISAASIIAKVSRDSYMMRMHQEYPLYGFARHKGYGTTGHKKALEEHGPCPLHRLSFFPLKNLKYPLPFH
ncbi:ribonuclease HII [Candidatus Uhrbacteria bacterium]|nr:ribonuclease HII [Candidatus Uhrbacteria bacterium]